MRILTIVVVVFLLAFSFFMIYVDYTELRYTADINRSDNINNDLLPYSEQPTQSLKCDVPADYKNRYGVFSYMLLKNSCEGGFAELDGIRCTPKHFIDCSSDYINQIKDLCSDVNADFNCNKYKYECRCNI